MRTPPEVRFWRYVIPCEGCWVWTGSADTKGYGMLGTPDYTRPRFANGKPRYRFDRAHRLSYQIHFGPIPDGVFVCHTCDNPSCVNPAHLFLGTILDNNRDKTAKGRHHNSVRTACVSGHPFDTANTAYARGHGGAKRRRCRLCSRAASDKSRDRARARMPSVLCACGCGETVRQTAYHGVATTVRGHHKRLKGLAIFGSWRAGQKDRRASTEVRATQGD